MNISFNRLMSSPTGTVVKATGHSGVTYYAEIDEDPTHGRVLVTSCPSKGYYRRRLRFEQVGWNIIELAIDKKEKNKHIKNLRR